MQKQPHHCKRGPGRRHAQGKGSRQQLTMKQKKAGAYGRWLRDWITGKNLAAMRYGV